MTLRRAVLALSLVAFAASAAASSLQSAPTPAAPTPGSAAPGSTAPAQPAPPPPASPATQAPATRSALPDETPIDPLAIAFDTSVDHDAEDAAGPKLLKYVIDFVPAAGAPGKSQTIDLGKPKPVQGSISVPLSKVLIPGTYVAHVRAIGRGLQTTTVTVGPFVITEKTGKTKAELDKELMAPDKPQDKRIKKPKEPQTEPQPPAPPQTAPPNDVKDDKTKDGSKPAGKGGFWKKFYGKVVG